MTYYVDNQPYEWRELIRLAEQYGDFDDPSFKRTSEAARILRNAGFTVTDQPAEKP